MNKHGLRFKVGYDGGHYNKVDPDHGVVLFPNGEGKGDSLWRTGNAYIAYGQPILKQGILSCFRRVERCDGTYYYQGARSFHRYRESDVSRDQIVLALAALKYNGDHADCSEIAKHLRVRLSNRFFQTPDFWLWRKSLESDSKFWSSLFCLLTACWFFYMFPWNLFCRWVGGFRPIPQGEFTATPKSELKPYQRFIIKIRGQMFGWYLTCWMVRTAPDNIFKGLAEAMVLLGTEKTNYLCRMLLGDYVAREQIIQYKSMMTFRWNKYLDKSADHLRFPEPYEIEYNDIDMDILRTVNDKIKEPVQSAVVGTNFSGRDIVIVDIQPSSKDYIYFDIYEFCEFINEMAVNNDITFLYNGPDLGYESEQEIMRWYLEYEMDEQVVDRSTWHEKGFAFFRSCMDVGYDDEDIVNVLKYMYKNDITDARELEDEHWDEIDVPDIREFVDGGDTMWIPEGLFDILKPLNNIVIMGGHISACLKETQLALDVLGKPYKEYSKFSYD